LLKGHRGFTSRLLRSATNSSSSLLKSEDLQVENAPVARQETHLALIDGPYGASNADFAAFDTVLLISGSTGVTFTLPILLDLASRVQKGRLPVRRVQFLWIVKNTSWTSWITSELQSAFATLKDAGVEVAITIYVTCDDKFTSDEDGATTTKECGCECDKSLGPCCCVNVEEDSDEIQEVDEKGTEVRVSPKTSSSLKSSSQSQKFSNSGIKSRVLPCAMFQSGRPDIYETLWQILELAEGETGVAVCGPLGLSSEVRRTVVRCSDERAVNKGSGAQGVFLHTECFGW